MNFFMRTFIKETMRINQKSSWLIFYLLTPNGLHYYVIMGDIEQ